MVHLAGLAGSDQTVPVDFVPNYQRVINGITADIAAGKYKPGEQLPPARVLVEQYGFSHNTIRRAVEILIDRRVLRGHQGLGVFVAHQVGGS